MKSNVKPKPAKSKVAAKPKPTPKPKTKPQAKPSAGANAKTAPVPPQPPAASSKSIYQAFVDDVLNGGRFELAEKYLDPVVVSHNPFPGQQPGIEGFVQALRAFRSAFPDLHARATHYIEEGDRVVGRFEVKGTHQGDFMGLAATGRPIHYEEIAIVRLAGGRIVEHWAVADALAIMQQLGKSDND
jgi:predicted ester cyclase